MGIFFCWFYIWILNFICTGQCLSDTEVGNPDPGKSSIKYVDPEKGSVLTRCYFTKFVQRSNSYKQDSLLSPKHIPTFTSLLSIWFGHFIVSQYDCLSQNFTSYFHLTCKYKRQPNLCSHEFLEFSPINVFWIYRYSVHHQTFNQSVAAEMVHQLEHSPGKRKVGCSNSYDLSL